MKMCLSYVCLNSLMPVPAVNGRDTCWPLFHFWLHHLWPKLVSLIKPAKHSNHKQVICQAKDKFWRDKKRVWSDKNFFLVSEIKRDSWDILVRQCGPFAKMLVTNLNGLNVKTTECKINTSITKRTFKLSQVLFSPLESDKFSNVCTPSLPSLTQSHVYSIFSCISSFPQNLR